MIWFYWSSQHKLTFLRECDIEEMTTNDNAHDQCKNQHFSATTDSCMSSDSNFECTTDESLDSVDSDFT